MTTKPLNGLKCSSAAANVLLSLCSGRVSAHANVLLEGTVPKHYYLISLFIPFIPFDSELDDYSEMFTCISCLKINAAALLLAEAKTKEKALASIVSVCLLFNS